MEEPSIILIEEAEINKISEDLRLNNECDDTKDNNTIDPFSDSSTLIEKTEDILNLESTVCVKSTSCEGSDSGLEFCSLQHASSINSAYSQEFGAVTPACSYESSIISCCSNYEEAYNILARRNSTLLEDYKLKTCNGTCEAGSESSSVTGSTSSKTSKHVNLSSTKKKQLSNKSPHKSSTPQRSRPTTTPRNASTRLRGKSNEKSHKKQDAPKTPKSKTNPNNLTLTLPKKDTKTKPPTSRGSSSTRTPITTPTDDGRWPSINSKPAPLMGRSVRADGTTKRNTPTLEVKSTVIEKYATLPRRRKEKSADSLQDLRTKPLKATVVKRPTSKDGSMPKSLPPYPRKTNTPKTRIYHEISIQTALSHIDLEKAFSGIQFNPAQPQDVETCDKDVQADERHEEIEKLQEQLKNLMESHEKLVVDYKIQNQNLLNVEEKLREERLEKDGLKEELKQNTDRVLAILGSDNSLPDDENSSSDSLLVLESRYQKVSQIMIRQENEISELNAYCRSVQRDLEKSMAAQKVLLKQYEDLESESLELQEFMQAEKGTLSDTLKELELEIKRLNLIITQKDKEHENKQDEIKRLVRINEQRRQENLALHARLSAFEARSRDLLIYQGSHISGATVALSSLLCRLEGLVDELVTCYNISDQELEDVIFHNEAYTNSSSSPDTTPEKSRKIFKEKTPSPKRGSSFVSAIINAIKSATAQTPFLSTKEFSEDNLTMDNSDSTEMLDSETEPCLMMEPVLEDVVIPDGHSHNMISLGHGMLGSARLTHSESLNNLSQAILCRQLSEEASETLNSSLSELCPSVPLVDQVIEVDNLVTRLLKVLRIIQIENDDSMNELQDERDQLSEQVRKQKDANKVVVQQLKDWEVLGAHLKSEITELMQQLSRKNNEIDDLKSELNQHRKEIERLNEDVCALSTACSKSEIELKQKYEETEEALKQWEQKEEIPTKDVLVKLFITQKEVPLLKEKLIEKEKQLNELKREFLDSRQVLSENWKEAVAEAKKQYDVIDNTLEILRSIQSVVQQCPPLAKLQRDLEETSFQSASSMPVVNPSDCNANGALIKAVNNLEIPSPINSTA